MLVGPGDINFRSIKVILSFLNQSTPIIPNGVISIVDVRGKKRNISFRFKMAKL